jgi:hypothetical protein
MPCQGPPAGSAVMSAAWLRSRLVDTAARHVGQDHGAPRAPLGRRDLPLACERWTLPANETSSHLISAGPVLVSKLYARVSDADVSRPYWMAVRLALCVTVCS